MITHPRIEAYELKEALRAVFAGDLDEDDVLTMLGRWCSWAQRRKHQGGILAAIARKLANGRHEGLNAKVRLIIRRAYGFHSAENALALILLACGPVTLTLPYHTRCDPHS